MEDLLALDFNQICVDCREPLSGHSHAEDSGWCSLNLGCFMCIHCSGAHRKLGAHYSKVRSLKWDKKAFTEESNLRKFREEGNKKVNALFEKKFPSYFVHLSEARELKHFREHFIRNKYENKLFHAENSDELIIQEMPQQILSGYIYMKKGKTEKYDKFYFQLIDKVFNRFKSLSDSTPAESIKDLGGLNIVIIDEETEMFTFQLMLNRTVLWTLASEDLEDMLTWVHALRKSSQYYLTQRDLMKPGSESQLSTTSSTPRSNNGESASASRRYIIPACYVVKAQVSRKEWNAGIVLGYAEKRPVTGFMTSFRWNKRWWKILGEGLYFFEKEPELDFSGPVQMKDGISLHFAQIHFPHPDQCKKQHCICVTNDQKSYLIHLKDSQTLQLWKQSLETAILKFRQHNKVHFGVSDGHPKVLG